MFCKRMLSVLWTILPLYAISQNTTGSIAGVVKTNSDEPMAGASVKLLHEPTGTLYYTKANQKGDFSIQNISPGGPYLLEVSFSGYITEKRNALNINLGENLSMEIRLLPQTVLLKSITVTNQTKNSFSGKGGSAIFITKEKLGLLPSTGRNLSDYLRSVPQAKQVNGNEGAISFAGQNNRYNAFYVDGAVNNDVFGLTASGTNGGQAAIAPLSIDAIDQFQIAPSPFDVSVGNFTGGSVNAITRSGTNKSEGSVYHFFSNQHLSGSTAPGKSQNAFSTQTTGMRLQGSFLPNRLFFFMSMEIQRNRYANSFDLSQYTGDTKDKTTLNILANTLRSTHHYDAGSFTEAPESVNADRLVMRIDWNMNPQNKITFSNRYTLGQRTYANQGNVNTIHFSNDGYQIHTLTNSSSFEWRSVWHTKDANKLTATYTSVTDDRGPAGKAFPRVRITDGEGAIIFGTDNSSTINLLTQRNWTLFDKYDLSAGKHHISMGMDAEYNLVHNAFVQNSFGNYTYASLSDFLTNQHPSAYQLGFSMIDKRNDDQTDAAAKFSVLKTAFFISDEIKPIYQLNLHFGIRADQYRFLKNPVENDSINLVYLPILSTYYATQNTRSGKAPVIPLSVSPRFGFLYHNTDNTLIIRGGAGIFSGRVPLAWPGGIYQNNGLFTGGFSADRQQLNNIRFRSDAYQQWTTAETGAVINKEPLNLIADKFQMPALFRTSVSIEKKINNTTLLAEFMMSKNLNEIKYTNLNLLPPTDTASGMDNRFIYSSVNNGKIPLLTNGANPYDYIILLSNDQKQTGHAQSISTTLKQKSQSGWNAELSYTYGRSMILQEGTSSVNVSQWRFMESVNGRNFLTRSVSDFSGGHRIFAWLHKPYVWAGKKTSLDISLTYTGQSGSPFSYVYGYRSMTMDDGLFGAYDLIYIPTTEELLQMEFLPNSIRGNQYTPEQQKEALEKFLQNDPYLQKHRGNYAERNGSRTPFSQRVDLKLKMDLKIKISKHQYTVQTSLDIFNIGNLINPNWGLQYEVGFDQFALVDFAGYKMQGHYIPQYRFNPELAQAGRVWGLNSTSDPTYSSGWSSQIGLRITFR